MSSVGKEAAVRFPFTPSVREVLTLALCLSLSSTFVAGVLAAPSPPATRSSVARSVPEAQNTFAFELYRGLANKPDANVFCSPYSVYSALAIVAEGARGETARDMGRLLALPRSMQRADRARPWDLSPLHAALSKQRHALTRDGEGSSPAERAEFDSLRARFGRADALALELRRRGDWDGATAVQETAAVLAAQVNALGKRVRLGELSLCDALWTDEACHPPAALVNVITPAYGAVLQQARFSTDAEGARRDINAWVASRTFGQIPDLLGPGDVRATTRMIVTDAVAFRGEWEYEFEPKRTREEWFRTARGDSARVPLMWNQDTLRYGAFDAAGRPFRTPAAYDPAERLDEANFYPGAGGFQLLELPYRGSALEMVVLLPRRPQDLASLEALLAAAPLERWLEQTERRPTSVHLPRFRFERGADLSQMLSAMGLARACDASRAELGGLVECAGEAQRLSIGGVIHRARIDVDEQGTVAVAATAIVLRSGSVARIGPVRFVPNVRADHPFVFLIRDRASGAILFIGRCVKP